MFDINFTWSQLSTKTCRVLGDGDVNSHSNQETFPKVEPSSPSIANGSFSAKQTVTLVLVRTSFISQSDATLLMLESSLSRLPIIQETKK